MLIERPWDRQPRANSGLQAADDEYRPASIFIPGLGDVLSRRYGSGSADVSGMARFGAAYAHGTSVGAHTQLSDNTSTWLNTSGGYSLLVLVQYGATRGTGMGVGARPIGGSVALRATMDLSSASNVTFDYGGATAGVTRVEATGVSKADGTVACYVATTGARGMEVWVDGYKLASNSANPSRTSGSIAFAVGDCYGGTAGTAVFGLVVPWNTQIPETLAAKYSRNPWSVLSPRRIWIPVSVSGGGTTYNQSIAGSITGEGILFKSTFKFPTGVVTSSGNVLKNTNKSFSGNISSSGTLNTGGNVSQATSGSITTTGLLSTASIFSRMYSASITMSGNLYKMTMKQVGGSISTIGNLIKTTYKTFTGSITGSSTISGFQFTPTISTIISSGIRHLRKFLGRR